jgi:hypothetical protein
MIARTDLIFGLITIVIACTLVIVFRKQLFSGLPGRFQRPLEAQLEPGEDLMEFSFGYSEAGWVREKFEIVGIGFLSNLETNFAIGLTDRRVILIGFLMFAPFPVRVLNAESFPHSEVAKIECIQDGTISGRLIIHVPGGTREVKVPLGPWLERAFRMAEVYS